MCLKTKRFPFFRLFFTSFFHFTSSIKFLFISPLPPHFLSPIPFPILHSPLQPPSLFFPSHFSLSLFLSPSSSRPSNIPLPLYLLSPSLSFILPFSLPPYFFLPISPSPFSFPPLLPDPQTFLFPSVI